METLVQYIDEHNLTDLFTIKDELTAELSKAKAKADSNRELYAEYHDAVMEVLASATVGCSAQEIADETGIARGKIVHGLSRIWTDEIEKDTSGKTTLYRRKA